MEDADRTDGQGLDIPLSSPAYQLVWAVVRRAGAALQCGDRPAAERHFAEALARAENLEPAERRRALSSLCVALLRQGFSRLAIPAAEAAIHLDERAGDLPYLCDDLIHYGWALAQEGHARQAEQAYEQVIDLAQRIKRFADAAAASTNLAVLFMRAGRFDEADRLFERSLAWLERQPAPDTEFRTRVFRGRCWDHADGPPEAILALAEETLVRLGPSMDEGLRLMMIDMLERPLQRFFTAHPEIVPGTWLRDHFALLEPK